MKRLLALPVLIFAACASAPPQSVVVPVPGSATATQDVVAPKSIRRVDPMGPATFTEPVDVLVVVVGTIDTHGNMTNVRVLRSDPRFDHFVVDAFRQWKFTPGTIDGKPVPVEYQSTFRMHRP